MSQVTTFREAAIQEMLSDIVRVEQSLKETLEELQFSVLENRRLIKQFESKFEANTGALIARANELNKSVEANIEAAKQAAVESVQLEIKEGANQAIREAIKETEHSFDSLYKGVMHKINYAIASYNEISFMNKLHVVAYAFFSGIGIGICYLLLDWIKKSG